ncbi:inner membrane protein YiaA [Bacteroides sp. 224]|uniref:inner membrane protein YiaA n=1 Tax=Bacteroides sp. 224 TaxID=2302936 RepID=UPI0013D87BE9|nr:inner membrane protein YiaA [Bacteroides sp. 224]NDV64179.1 hypothetical protein [Bacteroides sp. 224]
MEEEVKIANTPSKKSKTPSPAYIAATWIVLLIGVVCYLIGLYNAEMQLNEKGYYFTILLFGLFSVIALQKSVRDKLDGVPVTNIFLSISWFGTLASILLLVVGLWNAELLLSEKGFYGIAYTMSVYAAISVQKNIRDAEHEK